MHTLVYEENYNYHKIGQYVYHQEPSKIIYSGVEGQEVEGELEEHIHVLEKGASDAEEELKYTFVYVMRYV